MGNDALKKYLLWAFALAWALQALAVHFALDGQADVFQLSFPLWRKGNA